MTDNTPTESLVGFDGDGVPEIWRSVSGFESRYSVSSHGRVLSYMKGPYNRREPIYLRARIRGNYLGITLCRPGLHRNYYLHRLVAETFHGPCPNGMECAHLDGDKYNCAASNLKWATRLENIRHKAAHGTVVFGDKHKTSKLRAAIVRGLRKERAEKGTAYTTMAKRHGVHIQTIHDAIHGKTWRHVS